MLNYANLQEKKPGFFGEFLSTIAATGIPGVPKKVHKFKIKIFVLRSDQLLIKLVSFVRQVVNLDFDA